MLQFNYNLDVHSLLFDSYLAEWVGQVAYRLIQKL